MSFLVDVGQVVGLMPTARFCIYLSWTIGLVILVQLSCAWFSENLGLLLSLFDILIGLCSWLCIVCVSVITLVVQMWGWFKQHAFRFFLVEWHRLVWLCVVFGYSMIFLLEILATIWFVVVQIVDFLVSAARFRYFFCLDGIWFDWSCFTL